mgnify:CR=1 FL=1
MLTLAQVRQSLLQSTRSAKFEAEYQDLRNAHRSLRPHPSAEALVEWFGDRRVCRDAKNRAYAALVDATQCGSAHARTVVLLGLWPGVLAKLHELRRQLRDESNDDLFQALVDGMFAEIGRLPLDAVSNVAATLLLNARRRVVDGEKRRSRVAFDDVDPVAFEDRVAAGDASSHELREVCGDLARLGRDGEVVAMRVLGGFDRTETAALLGTNLTDVDRRQRRGLSRYAQG